MSALPYEEYEVLHVCSIDETQQGDPLGGLAFVFPSPKPGHPRLTRSTGCAIVLGRSPPDPLRTSLRPHTGAAFFGLEPLARKRILHGSLTRSQLHVRGIVRRLPTVSGRQSLGLCNRGVEIPNRIVIGWWGPDQLLVGTARIAIRGTS